MKFSRDFEKYSFYNDFYVHQIQELNSENLKVLFLSQGFTDLKYRRKDVVTVIHKFKERRYQEARMELKSAHNYEHFHSEIIEIRLAIKSLISGLMGSNSISKADEVADWLKKWHYYDPDNNHLGSRQNHHISLIFKQFKKVKTMDELLRFNEVCHKYVLELLLKLSEIFIRRINYTHQNLGEGLDDLINDLITEGRQFRLELEQLKE